MTMAAHPLELELLALVEGDLGRSETGALEEHVAGCLACSAAVATADATEILAKATWRCAEAEDEAAEEAEEAEADAATVEVFNR